MTNAKKIQRFHALLHRANLMQQKRNILNGYGVESTKDLSDFELDGLIAWLEGETKWGSLKDYQWALFDKNNQQHKYLLHLCQEFGWTVFDERRGRTVADLNRLGKWMRNRSKVRKPLKQQNTKDLHVTIYQFEQMVKKHFTKE